jgi:hypothetical protein
MLGERGFHEFFITQGGSTTGIGFRNHDKDKPTAVVVFCDGHAKHIAVTYGRWEGDTGQYNVTSTFGGGCSWIITQPTWYQP